MRFSPSMKPAASNVTEHSFFVLEKKMMLLAKFVFLIGNLISDGCAIFLYTFFGRWFNFFCFFSGMMLTPSRMFLIPPSLCSLPRLSIFSLVVLDSLTQVDHEYLN